MIDSCAWQEKLNNSTIFIQLYIQLAQS